MGGCRLIFQLSEVSVPRRLFQGQYYWQERRDSHLTPPSFCPTNRVHLTLPVQMELQIRTKYLRKCLDNCDDIIIIQTL